MHDHAKQTVRDFDPYHIKLHCGTNESNSDRTSSQIAREIIDPALSLKSDKNKISISLLKPRSDKLNDKASEVNNRLINMCSHRNIAYINHSSSIQQNHINESKVHLNRYGFLVGKHKGWKNRVDQINLHNFIPFNAGRFEAKSQKLTPFIQEGRKKGR